MSNGRSFWPEGFIAGGNTLQTHHRALAHTDPAPWITNQICAPQDVVSWGNKNSRLWWILLYSLILAKINMFTDSMIQPSIVVRAAIKALLCGRGNLFFHLPEWCIWGSESTEGRFSVKKVITSHSVLLLLLPSSPQPVAWNKTRVYPFHPCVCECPRNPNPDRVP